MNSALVHLRLYSLPRVSYRSLLRCVDIYWMFFNIENTNATESLSLFSTESIIMSAAAKSESGAMTNKLPSPPCTWEGMNDEMVLAGDWNAQADRSTQSQGNKTLSPELLAQHEPRELARATGGAFDFEKGGLFFAWRQQRSRELLDPAEAQRLALLPAQLSADGSPNSQPVIVGTSRYWRHGGRSGRKILRSMDVHTSKWTVREIFW